MASVTLLQTTLLKKHYLEKRTETLDIEREVFLIGNEILDFKTVRSTAA